MAVSSYRVMPDPGPRGDVACPSSRDDVNTAAAGLTGLRRRLAGGIADLRSNVDRGPRAHQTVWVHSGGGPDVLPGHAWARDRVPRPERCRQVDHHSHDPRAGRAHVGCAGGEWGPVPVLAAATA